MQRHTRLLLITFGLVLLTACTEPSTDGEGAETIARDSTETPTAEPSPSDPSTETEELDMNDSLPAPLTLDQAIAMARSDMTSRMDAGDDEIEVLVAQEVTWGDGSMGCPEPGMMYTQALVPGFFIHLRHGSTEAFYHAGRNGQPRYCPSDRSTPPIDGDGLAYGDGGTNDKD